MRSCLLPLALLMAIGCGEAVTEPTISGDAITETVAISVPSIVCENCAGGVCKTLEKSPGVASVEVDVETKVATVTIDQETFDADAALASLTEAGFEDAAVQ